MAEVVRAFDEPEAQPVLLALSQSAVFLVVSVNDRPGAAERVRDVVSDVNALVRAVGFRQSSAMLSCVVGFGSAYWDRIRPAGSPRPAGLHPFRALKGAVHDAPSTPGDVLFHIRAERSDLTFELSRQIMNAIGQWVTVDDHVTGFRYFDARDLLGFVDGTENPTGRGAAAAALIGDREPDFANGSYVIVQKYLHDLDGWNALTTETQERIIGRTKLSDIELDEAVKPTSAHNALTTIIEDGKEIKIIRYIKYLLYEEMYTIPGAKKKMADMNMSDLDGQLTLLRVPAAPPSVREPAPAAEPMQPAAPETPEERDTLHTDPGDGSEAAARLREELRRVKRELQDLLAALAAAAKGAP